MRERLLNELETKLEACGLSQDQVRCYMYVYRGMHLDDSLPLPTDEQLRTLEEALRIHAGTAGQSPLHPRVLGCHGIYRCLQVPCTAWQEAKGAIAECFGIGSAEVDALYGGNYEWLLVPAETVRTLAALLLPIYSNPAEALQVFTKAAFANTYTAQYRISAVQQMLGPEIGRKLMLADCRRFGYLFSRHDNDPVSCISYMLYRGLTPEKILEMIEGGSNILNDYKNDTYSLVHQQQMIDRIIRQHL